MRFHARSRGGPFSLAFLGTAADVTSLPAFLYDSSWSHLSSGSALRWDLCCLLLHSLPLSLPFLLWPGPGDLLRVPWPHEQNTLHPKLWHHVPPQHIGPSERPRWLCSHFLPPRFHPPPDPGSSAGQGKDWARWSFSDSSCPGKCQSNLTWHGWHAQGWANGGSLPPSSQAIRGFVVCRKCETLLKPTKNLPASFYQLVIKNCSTKKPKQNIAVGLTSEQLLGLLLSWHNI